MDAGQDKCRTMTFIHMPLRVRASATEVGSGSARAGPAGTLPAQDAQIGPYRLASRGHDEREGRWIDRMAQGMVGPPPLDVPTVAMPLDVGTRPDEPERLREAFVGGGAVDDLASKRARAMPPAVALILQEELSEHGFEYAGTRSTS